MTAMCIAVYMCVLIQEGFCSMMEVFSCCADYFINEEFDASDHTVVFIFADWFLTSSTGPLIL